MSNNTFKVRGYFGEWRNATKEETINQRIRRNNPSGKVRHNRKILERQMRKIVKILEKIRWRKNAIADEQERIELEFGSDHGPERQYQEEQLAMFIDEVDRLNNLFISYAKIDKMRKENKLINAWARKKIRSKDDRQEYIRGARKLAWRFFISELDQLN